MSCSTCERRQTTCDESRPRCSTCTRVHLKCVYSGAPTSFSFQDETEAVRAQATTSKRRKIVADLPKRDAEPKGPRYTALPGTQENIFQIGNDFERDWGLPFDMMPYPEISSWEQDLYVGLLPETSPGDLFTQIVSQPDFSDVSGPQIAVTGSVEASPNRSVPAVPRISHLTMMSSMDPKPAPDGQDLTEVPKHVLAQHYSLTAVHRQDSKSWNFYMHFYNRFATNHPPVLFAIYAYASAQLLYAKKIGSMKSALAHYDASQSELSSLYQIAIPDLSSSSADVILRNSLKEIDSESLDALLISLYFLALFDLLTTRSSHLRRILRLMPIIIRCRDQSQLSGTFLRLSTWFLYLDTRASLFGLGSEDSMIWTFGNEAELVEAVHASKNVLQEEYSILYPEDERERDKFSLPFLSRILKLMVIFREISRYNEYADDDTKARIRQKIDGQSNGLELTDEKFAKEKRLSNYYYTILSLYNAAEIYYSRTFNPDIPLYSANDHAAIILTTTEKMHRKMGLPQAATPHSKSWPIPLILATIEVRDPIHRNWGIRKLQDYCRAGDHYVKSCKLVELVCDAEEKKGTRQNLGDAMRQMDEEFVI